MLTRAVALGCLLAASISPITAAPAATIYNDLAVTVTVEAATDLPGGHKIVLPAGTNRGNLSWPDAYGLEVVYHAPGAPGQLLCHFFWGDDPSRLQGDGYFVILSRGHDVSCNICDANNKLVEFTYGQLPHSLPAYHSPERRCEAGE